MTQAGSDQAIVVSAIVVAGVYFYRKLVEPGVPASPKTKARAGTPAGALLGTGPVAPLGRFLTGFGIAYFAIAVIGSGAPGLGGWLAILLAAGSLLGNGIALINDVNHRLSA